MCGIAGIYSYRQTVKSSVLSSMIDAMEHRGPDGEGVWIGGEFGEIGLGHKRLSIIDLSIKGKQPMTFQNRYTITFNGEIYNHKKLRIDLGSRGYRFNSNSDTEVLLALFKDYEESFLSMLD
jgi:asparagine synthase (glutamine-hydrolysing)